MHQHGVKTAHTPCTCNTMSTSTHNLARQTVVSPSRAQEPQRQTCRAPPPRCPSYSQPETHHFLILVVTMNPSQHPMPHEALAALTCTVPPPHCPAALPPPPAAHPLLTGRSGAPCPVGRLQEAPVVRLWEDCGEIGQSCLRIELGIGLRALTAQAAGGQAERASAMQLALQVCRH